MNRHTFHVPTEATPEVEKVFEDMREHGLKKQFDRTQLNREVLEDHRTTPQDVRLHVEVALARARDSGSVTRRILAEDTASVMERDLAKTFRGTDESADLILSVRVVLTSEGNKSLRVLAGEVGAGSSMITVAYCLYSTINGKCVLAKQLHSREKSGGLKDLKENQAPAAIRRMASGLAEEIEKDVLEILGHDGAEETKV